MTRECAGGCERATRSGVVDLNRRKRGKLTTRDKPELTGKPKAVSQACPWARVRVIQSLRDADSPWVRVSSCVGARLRCHAARLNACRNATAHALATAPHTEPRAHADRRAACAACTSRGSTVRTDM
eukprot:1508305-Pleurochrysis_carterae.AAC.1